MSSTLSPKSLQCHLPSNDSNHISHANCSIAITSLPQDVEPFGSCRLRQLLKVDTHLFRLSKSQLMASENDIVLLSYTGKNRDTTPLLTKPLSSNTIINLNKTKIKGSDIIGKRVRETVETSDRQRLKLRINRPTLAQYSDLSPRIVTPVSLLLENIRICTDPQSDERIKRLS